MGNMSQEKPVLGFRLFECGLKDYDGLIGAIAEKPSADELIYTRPRADHARCLWHKGCRTFRRLNLRQFVRNP
jgi:hypothetical protein